MTNREYLLNVIKPQVAVGEKNTDELILWLQQRFDIEFLSENDVNSFLLGIIKKDAAANGRDQNLLAEDEGEAALAFDIIAIERNEKSEFYYAERGDDFRPTSKIIVYLERKTGFIFVNASNPLFSELLLERGISQSDFDHNTPRLMGYLGCYKEMSEESENTRAVLKPVIRLDFGSIKLYLDAGRMVYYEEKNNDIDHNQRHFADWLRYCDFSAI